MKKKRAMKSCQEIKEELTPEGNYLVWQEFRKEVPREKYLEGCLGEMGKFSIEERVLGAKYLTNSLSSSPEKNKGLGSAGESWKRV